MPLLPAVLNKSTQNQNSRIILITDKNRFDKILELLPENFVDVFCNVWLFNCRYPTDFGEQLIKYQEYKKEIMSEFSNAKINAEYKIFNKLFDELNSFLTKHFGYMNDIPQFFYLEPAIHHNSHPEQTQEESLKWDSSRYYLKELTSKFYEAYIKFIGFARNEIEKQETAKHEIQSNENAVNIINTKKFFNTGVFSGNHNQFNNQKDRWWENTWVQLIMFVSAIIGIVAFYFFILTF